MRGGGSRDPNDDGARRVVEGAVVDGETAERAAPATTSSRAHRIPTVVIALAGLGFVAIAARLSSAPPAPTPPDPRDDRDPEQNTAPTAIAPEVPRRFVAPPAPRERRGVVSADDEGDAPGANQDLRDALTRGRAAAQGCAGVTPHTSHAMLRFGADGAVEAVVVAAPYAGTAAEPCIERAFLAASLPTGRGRAFSATAGF